MAEGKAEMPEREILRMAALLGEGDEGLGREELRRTLKSCGIDPAPFFRIFNPVVQGQRFDPEGAYVRQFVPELCLVPQEFIHHPWDASEEDLASWNVHLGVNYPNPIIGIAEGRDRAMKAFRGS